jgi:hypothetical protein
MLRVSEQGRKVTGPSGGGLGGVGAQLVWGLRVALQPASDDPGNFVRGRVMPVAGLVQGGPLAAADGVRGSTVRRIPAGPAFPPRAW